MQGTLSITEIRERLAEVADQVQSGERIAIEQQGKTLAVLVPPSDLQAVAAIDDRLDLLDALDALADYRANGGIDLEALKKELGL